MKFYHEDARDIPIIAEPEILVAGAGPAGIGAAIAAARSGAKVMLIEKGAYPGGIATMGMMSHWSGATQCPLMNESAERTMKSAALPAETNPGLSKFDLFWGIPHECLKQVLFEMLKEAGVTLQLHTMAVGVIKENNKVKVLLPRMPYTDRLCTCCSCGYYFLCSCGENA